MKLCFSDQALDLTPPSLFLGGPTPRRDGVPSWRPGALATLRQLGFSGTVLVPERHDWATRFDYHDQVEWEFAGLEGCSVILFWLPRRMDSLPGLTTNVEFGRYVGSGRCVYGRPDDAEKVKYLDWLYEKLTRRAPARTLEDALREALDLIPHVARS